MTQNRLKSPIFWSAITAQIFSLLVLCGVIDMTQSEILNSAVIILCELLTAFGILNNPTNKGGI